MSDVSNTFLLVYAALFPIVNPLGSAPVFLSLTRHYSPRTRHALALRVAVNGFLLLLGSLFVGSHILDFFGITLPIVRIAGGCVVVSMAWQLLREGVSAPEDEDVTTESDQGAWESAFYPLTMPLTVGPGSIATAITLGSQRPIVIAEFSSLLTLAGSAVAALVALGATIYVSYRFAEGIAAVFGRTGMPVVIRLSAFILLCIGFQIVWSGVSSLLPELAHGTTLALRPA
jgi:multiple antibiotic resistance protein